MLKPREDKLRIWPRAYAGVKMRTTVHVEPATKDESKFAGAVTPVWYLKLGAFVSFSYTKYWNSKLRTDSLSKNIISDIFMISISCK